MKAKIIIFILTFLSTNLVISQNKCDCNTALNNLISKIEKVYPGLEEKTKDKLLYDSLKKQLAIEAASNNKDCIKTLKKYTSFFKDRHIWIKKNEIENLVSVSGNKTKKYKKLAINIAKFKRKIKKSKDKLEGIWKSKSYTIGIKKTNENQYTGFVITTKNKDWQPKEIKFKLKSKDSITYYLSDHSKFEDTFKIYDDYILHLKTLKSSFVKQNLPTKVDTVELAAKIDELEGFYFKPLTSKTSLLTISSFNYPFVKRIEKLIDDNLATIENSENLIIDVRDNGGGTDVAYRKLMPLIATNPTRYINAELLCTQTLIDGVTKYRNGLFEKDAEKNKSEINRLDNLVAIYKENFGKFVNPSGRDVIIDTVRIAKRSPKQIIILSNKNTGSAAENFLMLAKQSKKVKILGKPSAGVLDYANAYFFKFGCDNYKLLLPTYRSLRLPDYPIDNIGVQPDIYLDKSINDWVKFSIDYLEN